MRQLFLKAAGLVDILLLPFVYPSAWILKLVRRAGVHRLPICKKALLSVGVFPIRNHYYEPQFDYRTTTQPYEDDRLLPGIDLNTEEQLHTLTQLTYAQELADLPTSAPAPRDRSQVPEFHLQNAFFEFGDAEYWYQMLRWKKPARIIEIGSGYSTLMARKAISKNQEEVPGYAPTHVCIEPYEKPWLEATGVTIIRKRLEDVDLSVFEELEDGDILFIDSSHMIRPQGDVVLEYLKILPVLAKGVIVHIHDIYSPANYPKRLLEFFVVFWNEQYMVEAFLTQNSKWKIIGAVNYLHKHFPEQLAACAPFVRGDVPPSSIYIQRVA